MIAPEDLLARIETFLKANDDYSPSRLGKEAVGDPNFVQDLREGREPRRKTSERAAAFLDQQERARAA